MEIFIKTTIPLFLLIGLGYISRWRNILKAGDERILSAYVYYFALPALFFVNIAETQFTANVTIFALIGIAPIIIILSLLTILFFVFRFPKKIYFLLVLCSVFGSHAFFGIPFVIFAFSNPMAEHLGTLSAGLISIVSVLIAVGILELHQLSQKKRPSIREALQHVGTKLLLNPLVISILLGLLISLSGIRLPFAISKPIHMLGSSTAAVAIFMLGVFFYGRKYKNLGLAFILSLLRIIIVPLIAVGVITLFPLTDLESLIIVSMSAMPMAISMIVLSERYNFYKDTIASIILVSSLLAGIYLNVWLAILGN